MSNPSHFHGPLRVPPTHGRYRSDDSGKPIYLTGSHTWAVTQSMWPENRSRHDMGYDAFLQMLEDHGHNVLPF